MQLLVEYNEITYSDQLLKEAADPSNPLILRSVVLQRADHRNQNGRIYPKDILKREAVSYKTNFVTQRRALGELDHPESPVVNLKNACCNVNRLWFDNDDVVGDVEILTTPSGNIVRELVKNGIKLGISSRGVGSTKRIAENTTEVQEDFSLICFDIVSNPSTHGAFINEHASELIINPYSKLDGLIYNFLSEIK